MIEVQDIDVHFQAHHHDKHAVKSVSFKVAKGECLGIVGESGCGKSTVLRSLAGLETHWTGSISMAGRKVGQKRQRDDLPLVQMVFQDPYGSLHPRHRIGRALKEPLIAMGRAVDGDVAEAALEGVGLPRNFAGRFPHQLSGGQRQRVAIARALLLKPPIVLLDEHDLGARRFGAGGSAEPSVGAAPRDGPDLRLRQPRPSASSGRCAIG